MIELLFILFGIVVGYNIRHERQVHQENLVLEKVDAKVRRDLQVAQHLNQSLQSDVLDLRRRLRESRTVMP